VEGLEVLVDESVVAVGVALGSFWDGASVLVVAGALSATVVPVVVEPVVELPVVVVDGAASGVLEGAVDVVVVAAVVVVSEVPDPLPDPLLPQLAALVAAAAAAVLAPSLVSHLAAAPAVVRLVATMVKAAPSSTRRSPRPPGVPRDGTGRLGLVLRTAARCVSMQETCLAVWRSIPTVGRVYPDRVSNCQKTCCPPTDRSSENRTV